MARSIARRVAPRVAALVACAACGRSSPSADRNPPAVAPPPGDERCDPSQPRQCRGEDVVACEPDGTLGRRLQACHDGCEDGACVATCADDGARLIYLVDDAGDLLSFDPRKLDAGGDPFARVGALACGRHLGQPYSMSVDRRGTAWVVYTAGALFKVSIADARCRPTRFARGSRLGRFGMGFASDQPGGATEQLYLAAADGSRALMAIAPPRDLTPRQVGELTHDTQANPELTGTSEARLYAFYPERDRPSFIQELDRATGAARGPRWTLGSAPLPQVTAYAFAQWAGVFYVFVTTDGFERNTSVRTVDPATGAYRIVLEHVPYAITGAGVSTCAPARGQ